MTGKTHAISWSGGKDCFLALVTLLEQRKINLDEVMFVTFVPQEGPFYCHPLGILENQSRQLGITHEFLVVDEDHWLQGYKNSLEYLCDEYQISHFVTGEVFLEESPGESYWLKVILDELNLKLANPVTPKPARYMLELLSHYQITATTTGMKDEFFHPDFLNKPLTWNLLEETGLSQLKNFGWYGENGEYHTLVTKYQDKIFAPDFPTPTSTIKKGNIIVINLPETCHTLKHSTRKQAIRKKTTGR